MNFMRRILEEFACGNITPEARFFKRDSEYGKAMYALSDIEEKLLALLNENEKKLFDDFSKAQSEISFLSGIDKFIYGYRLGVLMTTEVFEGKENLIVGGEVR